MTKSCFWNVSVILLMVLRSVDALWFNLEFDFLVSICVARVCQIFLFYQNDENGNQLKNIIIDKGLLQQAVQYLEIYTPSKSFKYVVDCCLYRTQQTSSYEHASIKDGFGSPIFRDETRRDNWGGGEYSYFVFCPTDFFCKQFFLRYVNMNT